MSDLGDVTANPQSAKKPDYTQNPDFGEEKRKVVFA
jgi:hypothetical protein